MRKDRKGHLLLGGYDNLNDFFTNFKSQELIDNKVEQFMKKYKWAKKSVLRLIELINN
jgi:hypothetical protein